MSVFSGPEIVNSGLVLNIDAANKRSYPGTGTTWTDLSGNSNNGTLMNGVGYSSNSLGSFIFDGANDYITIENSSSLNISGLNITLEAVYKNNDLASTLHGDGIISKGSGSNDGQYEILSLPVDTKNKVFFRCATMGNYSPGLILMDVGIPYMISCVLDNGYMRIYINGVMDGAGEQKTGSIISRNTVTAIGSRQLQIGSNFSALNGSIYSTRIYNRALTTGEIKQNFEATRGRYGI